MEPIKPSIVKPFVVSGPEVKLYPNNIRSEDAKRRMRDMENNIRMTLESRKYKNRDKTPAAVKAAGAGILLTVLIGFLKLRLKK